MALALCTISGRVYKGDGTAAKNTKIKAVKVVLADELIATTPIAVFTDSDGDFEMSLPQGATAWLYGEVQGLGTNGVAGVPLAIPEADSANLSTLVPPTNTPGLVPIAVPTAEPPTYATIGDGVATDYLVAHNRNSEKSLLVFEKPPAIRKWPI